MLDFETPSSSRQKGSETVCTFLSNEHWMYVCKLFRV